MITHFCCLSRLINYIYILINKQMNYKELEKFKKTHSTKEYYEQVYLSIQQGKITVGEMVELIEGDDIDNLD